MYSLELPCVTKRCWDVSTLTKVEPRFPNLDRLLYALSFLFYFLKKKNFSSSLP